MKTIREVELEEKNRELKDRINKAIEYIKHTEFYGMRSGKTLISKYLNELLNILKGDNK